jgi:hypothetical protein
MKRILPFLPYILFLGYVGFNEYRLSDYAHVRSDAIIAVHYPEQIKK